MSNPLGYESFSTRHIGPSAQEKAAMLKELGCEDMEDLLSKVIPKSIRTRKSFGAELNELSEFETLELLKQMMGQNKVYRSFIGLGFHDTITPPVIARNIFENPVWYTAYTPYQPEISQGRLESLLNFQTMVADLTGMAISNASLLDEGSAAAEAAGMALSLSKNSGQILLLDEELHPHVIEVVQTRMTPLGVTTQVINPLENKLPKDAFALIVAYPGTTGIIRDFRAVSSVLKAQQSFLIVTVDLLSLAILEAPGEWGADIVVGNSQRFGVPLGNGGPHAAFLATKDEYKRQIPGRIVGVSVDARGKKAYRLALQTREQHIRREKATSNICTAQVLLANMAAMYGVYHGPEGIKKIANKVHQLTRILALGLKQLGFELLHEENFFDTLVVKTPDARRIVQRGYDQLFNLFLRSDTEIGISLNETASPRCVDKILQAFAVDGKTPKSASQLWEELEHQDRLAIQPSFKRKTRFMEHPVFNSYHSETELLRYIQKLQSRDFSLAHGMIPLGSCTMKLNSTSELMSLSWPEVAKIHPFAPVDQMTGYLQLIKDLENKLISITGFAAVSLQPNSGAQGEYAGLLVIRKYFESKGETQRKICLIPQSAHGTNPASAVMAGMQVIVVKCDEAGNIDIEDVKRKTAEFGKKIAAMMITYPSTHGVFEEEIQELCRLVHEQGGQVYMDGANLNALVGLCCPGEFGPDVAHMNLHKTFAIPHGGGGPGVGPIGVAQHLAPFLPSHRMQPLAGPEQGIGALTSAPWGSASILTISWAYIQMMGIQGLREATATAILNANYLAKKLDPYFPILYKGRNGFVAHECILDLREIKKTADVDVNDVAKRLMDYGFHAPTMSWPVAGTLMVEPTESEGKAELDRFLQAMILIRKEIADIENKKVAVEQSPLRQAPHTQDRLTATEWGLPYSREQAAFPVESLKNAKFWPTVARVDNAYGDKNLVCSCPPLDEYS